MKKIKSVVLACFMFFASIGIVNAACSAEETNKINSLATNVRVSYELLEREIEITEDFNFPDGITEEEMENYVAKESFFRIYISNVTEELYVNVIDTQTNKTKTYTYADAKDGVITIDQTDMTSINNYTFMVYSSSATGCPNRRLYTLYLTTPMYNSYNESDLCVDIEEFYLCHEFLSVPVVSFDDFVKLTDNYRAGKINEKGEEITNTQKKEEKGFAQFIKKHRNMVIVVSVIVVATGGLVTVIIVKKQRSRIV